MAKKTSGLKNWRRAVGSRSFARKYAWAALVVLLLTTVFWATQSAILQAANADQLANPYLFQSSYVLQHATWPGAHSFLFKWPLFWLVKLLGYGAAFQIVTVLTVLLTVGCLAAILYRIDRRPLVFGTLCLALASVLLMIPAQPYAGGLLPVNMAMLATRNLEYVVFMAGLWLVIGSRRLRDRRFWAGLALLALLVTSDKLFLSLGLGAALLALVTYGLRPGNKLVSPAARWLVALVLAGGLAVLLLALLSTAHLTHIETSFAGPFGVVHSIHQLVLGGLYAGMGLLTNFGANPAYDATLVRQIPGHSLNGLLSISGPAYVINLVLFVGGLYMAGRLLWESVRDDHPKARFSHDGPALLAVALVWSAIAALVVFVISDHYYAVDARYLTIALFALFVSAASFSRQHKWPAQRLVVVGAILGLGIICGLFGSARVNHRQTSALSDVNARNRLVAQALRQHPVQTLVGDYWRVLPARYQTGDRLNVLPLQDCTVPRLSLSSTAWQPDLRHHSFAYLLSLDRSLTDYPSCSLERITTAYGRPNASAVIAGRLDAPKELLLFYDHGSHPPKQAAPSQQLNPSTVLPQSLSDLPAGNCDRPAVMNIVAHQDDDLLFMSPDLIRSINAGYCVRTVYVTAGDAGADTFYWLGREQGSEAAYSEMLHIKNVWIQRTVKLEDKRFVTIANPRNRPDVSLVFMHLPDGNLKGDGFQVTRHESLQHLKDGSLATIHSVDGQSRYSTKQLQSALASLMHYFSPNEIRTQASLPSQQYPDHSDHMAVGHLVKDAYQQYEAQQFEDQLTIPLKFYVGYPVHTMYPNVNDGELAQKQAAYLAYAVFDHAVCTSVKSCNDSSTLGGYLQRQYQNDY